MEARIFGFLVALASTSAAATPFGAPRAIDDTSAYHVDAETPKGRQPLRVKIGGFSVIAPSTSGASGSKSMTLFIPVLDPKTLSGRNVDVDFVYIVASSGWTEGRIVALANGGLLAKRLPKPPVSGLSAQKMQFRLKGDLIMTYGGIRLDLLIQALTRGQGRVVIEPRTVTVTVR